MRRRAWMRWLPPIDSDVAVAGDDPHVEVGPGHGQPGGDGRRPAVDAVHPVGVHVVREAGGAADARHEHRVLAAHAEVGHQHLDGGEDRVVAAARAPAHLLVARPVLAGGDGDRSVGQSSRPPSASRMAASSSPAVNGHALHLGDRAGRRPGTRPARSRDELARGSSRARAPAGSAAAPRRGCAGNGLRCTRWAWATLRPRARHRSTAAADGAPRRAPAERRASRRRRRRRCTSTGGMSSAMPAILAARRCDHALVVGRVVGDVAGAVLLLDAADAVHRGPGVPGHGPRPGQRVGIAQVGPELRRRRRRRCGWARWRTATEMSGSESTSGSRHGSEPLAR